MEGVWKDLKKFIHKESVIEIWVDTVTGVNYVYHKNTNSGGLTPLLDENGKIVVSKNI